MKYISFRSSVVLLLAIFCSSFVLGTQIENEHLLRIHGSNTIGAKLAPLLVEGYLKKIGITNVERRPIKAEEVIICGKKDDELISVEIKAHGSSTGFKGLAAGECDIGMASRKIKENEMVLLKSKGFGDMASIDSEHIIALDGIAVIINQANPIEELNKSEIAAVFSGIITNWEELGGQPGNINVYARDDNSGTYDTFKNLVLGKQTRIVKHAKRFDSNADLSDDVSRDPFGIGFVGLPYIRNSKAIAVSDGDASPIYPTIFTVRTEDYVLARRLHLYSKAQSDNPYIHDFIDFVLSPEGQKYVEQVGFVDLNIRIEQQNKKKVGFPEIYSEIATTGQRLSESLRFGINKRNLDARSQQKLDRLVKYIKWYFPGKEIILIGFSDSIGNYHYNVQLSRNRAFMIAKSFQDQGIRVKKTLGLGPEVPVASNSSEEGRAKNRRVEVWIES